MLHVPTHCTPFMCLNCCTPFMCLPAAHHSRQCATRAYLLHTILVNVLHVPPYCTPFSSMCYTCLPTALTLPPTAHHFTLQKGGSAWFCSSHQQQKHTCMLPPKLVIRSFSRAHLLPIHAGLTGLPHHEERPSLKMVYIEKEKKRRV